MKTDILKLSEITDISKTIQNSLIPLDLLNRGSSNYLENKAYWINTLKQINEIIFINDLNTNKLFKGFSTFLIQLESFGSHIWLSDGFDVTNNINLTHLKPSKYDPINESDYKHWTDVESKLMTLENILTVKLTEKNYFFYQFTERELIDLKYCELFAENLLLLTTSVKNKINEERVKYLTK